MPTPVKMKNGGAGYQKEGIQNGVSERQFDYSKIDFTSQSSILQHLSPDESYYDLFRTSSLSNVAAVGMSTER